MNTLTKKAILAASLSLALVGTALAQSNQDGQAANDRMLDQLSRQRLMAHPHNFGTPPPQSSIPPTKVIPLSGLWVCRSFTLYTPIYARPLTKSRVVGRTLMWGAVTGAYVEGFQRVLVHRGLVGYVAKQFVHPFHDKVDPSATCVIEGTQTNGLPLISVR